MAWGQEYAVAGDEVAKLDILGDVAAGEMCNSAWLYGKAGRILPMQCSRGLADFRDGSRAIGALFGVLRYGIIPCVCGYMLGRASSRSIVRLAKVVERRLRGCIRRCRGRVVRRSRLGIL